MEKQVSEGSLHKWFKGSKSKDGKGGWVNVVTGGTCASDEPGEGTPKCVSSAKRASMTKAERLSAARRKKKADPGQQQKSGAAKPTYVSTDKPKKKKMKETYERSLTPLTEKAKKCWPGYEKKGTKKMFGKTYNNCVKKEEVEIVDEAKVDQGKDDASKVNTRNQRAFGNRRGSKGGGHTGDDMEARRYNTKKGRGVKMRGKKDKTPVNYHKRDRDKAVDELLGRTKKKEPTYLQKKGRQVDIKRKIKSGYYEEVELEAYSANPAQQAAIAIAKKKKKEDDMVAKKKKQKMYAGYEPQGETIEEADKKGKGSGKKDACYHKVKSRYSVWPSAYASGALVKCRKVGAANWGNSSKKEDFSDWKSEFIWEDGDSSKKLDEDNSNRRIMPHIIRPGDDKDKRKIMPHIIRPGDDKDKRKIMPHIIKPGDEPTRKPMPLRPGDKVERKPMPLRPGDKPNITLYKDHYDWRLELDDDVLYRLGEDWQKTNRQDKTDGMSQKAVNAYKRENPGSKLKTAVTAKPSTLKRGSKKAKRRKSFCSRMKGMKKRLTSAKTARDPDSRINKALRRWNC